MSQRVEGGQLMYWQKQLEDHHPMAWIASVEAPRWAAQVAPCHGIGCARSKEICQAHMKGAQESRNRADRGI